MCRSLKAVGARILLLDGSFVTKKPVPGDYDACYYGAEVDMSKLDPVFTLFDNERQAMKNKFGGEAFAAEWLARGWEPYEFFFQHDKDGMKWTHL